MVERNYMEDQKIIISGKDIFSRIENHLKPNEKMKDMIENLGFNKASVYRWKSDDVIPKTKDILKIAEYLRVSLYWLLTGIDDRDLSEQQKKILNEFEKLNDIGKETAINAVIGMALSSKFCDQTLDSPIEKTQRIAPLKKAL